MTLAQFLDDTLSDDVVRQASERLGADDILDTAVDQLKHLTGQKPSLTGLVSEGDIVFSHVCKLPDAGRRSEVLALLKFFSCGLSEVLKQGDSEVAQAGGGLLSTEVICLEVAVVEAVQQEIHQIRHHSFCAFRFKQLDDVVVCERGELYKDLSDNADLRLLRAGALKAIEIADDSTQVSSKFHHASGAG